MGARRVERSYAATLGLLAFLTALGRGAVQGAGLEPTLLSAWLALLAFTCLGAGLGWLGRWIIDDAVRTRMANELEHKP